MMWLIEIHAWAHASGNGQEADQAACGGRIFSFQLQAHDFAEAFARAGLIKRGIETNPAVWQAPIMKIERAR